MKNFPYETLQGFSGAELANQIPRPMRIDMTCKGYSPLSYDDLEAFCTGKKPVNSLFEAAGVGKKRFNNMGSGSQRDESDWKAIFKATEGNGEWDEQESAPISDRESVREQMNNNYSSKGNFSSKLDSLTERVAPNQQPQPSRALITDKKEAAKLGYANMASLLKANKMLMEGNDLSVANKIASITQKLISDKNKVHPSLHKDYDYGVNYAKQKNA